MAAQQPRDLLNRKCDLSTKFSVSNKDSYSIHRLNVDDVTGGFFINTYAHQYILVEHVKINGDRCQFTIGLLNPVKTKNIVIEIPDPVVSTCAHKYSKCKSEKRQQATCRSVCTPIDKIVAEFKDPRKFIVHGKIVRYSGKEAKGKLNEYQVKIIQFIFSHAERISVDDRFSMKLVIPSMTYEFACKYVKPIKSKVSYGQTRQMFNCHEFTDQFHNDPKSLFEKHFVTIHPTYSVYSRMNQIENRGFSNEIAQLIVSTYMGKEKIDFSPADIQYLQEDKISMETIKILLRNRAIGRNAYWTSFSMKEFKEMDIPQNDIKRLQDIKISKLQEQQKTSRDLAQFLIKNEDEIYWSDDDSWPIYALVKMEKYGISISTIKKLIKNFDDIFEIMGEEEEYGDLTALDFQKIGIAEDDIKRLLLLYNEPQQQQKQSPQQKGKGKQKQKQSPQQKGKGKQKQKQSPQQKGKGKQKQKQSPQQKQSDSKKRKRQS